MYRLITALPTTPSRRHERATTGRRHVRAERCVYTPHSLRATTATLLLAEGVEITAVQHLLGHKQLSVTQIYDKRRRATRHSDVAPCADLN